MPTSKSDRSCRSTSRSVALRCYLSRLPVHAQAGVDLPRQLFDPQRELLADPCQLGVLLQQREDLLLQTGGDLLPFEAGGGQGLPVLGIGFGEGLVAVRLA